jgi:mono/diheme cytochrome c family protein
VIRRIKLFSSPLLIGLFAILANSVPLFAASKSDQEKSGAVLFRDKGCTYCHGVGGVGTKKAPSLIGLPKDKTWTPDKITSQILNGGQKMPPFRESVTDNDVTDLIAYLRAKNKPVPPAATAEDPAPASSPQ